MSVRTHDAPAPPVALVVLAAIATLVGCGGGKPPHPVRLSPVLSPVASASAAPATPPAASEPGPPRTHDELLAAIGGRHIRVDGHTIRIDRATVACGGIDRAAGRVHGRPAWTRFSCIQPTFPRGSVAGPDLDFVVESAAPHRLVVVRRRLTSY